MIPRRIVDRVSATDTSRVYLAACFSLLCLLPLLILRDYTPANELKYLSIADEAIRNHHWFVMTNHGIPYTDKPPFYFWIIMVSKLLFGRHILGILSFFSIFPALITAFIMDHWCKPYLDGNSRVTAILLLLTTGYYAGASVVLRMDMLMTMFIVGAIYCFYCLYSKVGKKNKYQWAFAICILMAIYSKGFMGFLVPLVSCIVFLLSKKQIKSIGQYWGWRTCLILVLGMGWWFSMVAYEGGAAYLYSLTVGQSLNRSFMHAPHEHPFYYYLVYMTYTIAPWTLFYVITFCKAFKFKNNDLVRLFLIVIGSTFIMLSCFKCKLEIYLLPIIPFICYLSFIVFQKIKKNFVLWSSVFLFPMGLLVFTVPFYLWTMHNNSIPVRSGWMLLAALIISLFTLYGIYQILYYRRLLLGVRYLCIGLFLGLFFGGFSLLQFNPYIGYHHSAKVALLLQDKWDTKGICTFNMKSSENMDAFTGCSVQKVKSDEIDKKENKNKILIIPEIEYNDKTLQVGLRNRCCRFKALNYWYVRL